MRIYQVETKFEDEGQVFQKSYPCQSVTGCIDYLKTVLKVFPSAFYRVIVFDYVSNLHCFQFNLKSTESVSYFVFDYLEKDSINTQNEDK